MTILQYYKGAKLMELKYFVVKEEVQKRTVSIKHIINTKLMIVDLLINKGLPPKTFNDYVKRIGISRYDINYVI